MALTQKILATVLHAGGKIVVTKTTFDASYVTGGFAVTPASVGLYGYSAVVPVAVNSGFEVQFDPDTEKLVVYGTGAADKAAGTEQDAATDLSALSCNLIIFGT